MERTLVLAKPDALQRGLVGTILSRFEQKGLKLVGLKMRRFPDEVIQEHYSVHADKPFYGNLVSFMTSGPVVAMAFDGKDAIKVVPVSGNLLIPRRCDATYGIDATSDPDGILTGHPNDCAIYSTAKCSTVTIPDQFLDEARYCPNTSTLSTAILTARPPYEFMLAITC